MIHLDTDFLIQALMPGTDAEPRLRGWLAEGESLAMSSVAWAEFSCGPHPPMALEIARRLVPTIVPFDAAEAAVAAQLYNESGRRRGSIVDCMIAATAQLADAPIATLNVRDFERFSGAGLRIV